MADLNDEIREVAALDAQRTTLSTEIEERITKMRERVRAGESTGDPIRDHVIRKFGHVSEEFEAVYRDLVEKTTGHPGQFVLMITRREGSRGVASAASPSISLRRPIFWVSLRTSRNSS